MAKVIVERPRLYNSGKPKGYHRAQARHGDDLPRREGMKTRWLGRPKVLNEHLGPLRRYLDDQVGRPWDKVFSEVCAHVDRSSAVQDHVRDHVDQYVARNVLLVGRVPCSNEGRTIGRPLKELWGVRWYVCPRTGLLRRVVREGRKARRQKARPAPAPRFVRVDDAHQCRLMNGVWQLITLAPLPPEGVRARAEKRDVVLNQSVRSLTDEEVVKQYGAVVFAVEARPLARRELRNYPIPVEWWPAKG